MKQIEAPSFFSSQDQGGSRSTLMNGSSSFLYNGGPPTTKGAQPRTRDARGAWSPAAREYGGGGVVVESGECIEYGLIFHLFKLILVIHANTSDGTNHIV
jgi:hypothetical protein